jgi:hypothetical protein
MGQPQKIKYTALQRRALLSADLDTGRLPLIDDQGLTVHLATRKALEAKDLVRYVAGAEYYDLTELGATEARRLQAERQVRSARCHAKSHKSVQVETILRRFDRWAQTLRIPSATS